MRVFVSLFDSAAASVFIAITAFGHSFPVHEEEDEYEHWKRCSDQRTLGCLVKTWMFLPKRSFSFDDLVQCHVDRLVLPVHGAWCGHWFICRIALGFVSPFHPSLFLLLPACVLSFSLNVVQPMEGQLLSILLRWLFWVTFNIFFFFFSSLKFD